ncbi:MAG: ABC transporter substrate-binding protein [Nocardioidaceae bacterium]
MGQDPARQAPAAKIDGARKGGTLRVISSGGTSTFGLTEAFRNLNLSILGGLVVRSLTQYSYDPKTKTMVLVPDLATDLGVPNDDFTSWTFTIRKGVKFENGHEVTPADIKYAIERSMDRKTFPSGLRYSSQYFRNADEYAQKVERAAKQPDSGGNYHGVEYNGVVVDGQKLTIKMARPFPNMPYWGAFPAMSPIPAGNAVPSKYSKHPLATGPYMFDTYTPGKSLTLVKNPEWDADTDPARRQLVDAFDFDFDVDVNKVDEIMVSDKGDATTTVSINSVLRQDYANFDKDRLVTGPYPCTNMLDPDNRKITNVNVRRALGWAFPYKDYYAASGAILGVTRVPATNVFPPGVPGRKKYNPLPGHKPWSTDADKAKKLLEQEGKLGYVLKWPYYKDISTSVASKDVLVKALTKAGFDPQPIGTTSEQQSQYALNPDADINLRFVGWCADWPSGSFWFRTAFQSTDFDEEGFGGNFSAFSNKHLDARINEIGKMPLDQQPKAWNALDKTMQTKYYPIITLSYTSKALMRGSEVHGVSVDNIRGVPTWKRIWLG